MAHLPDRPAASRANLPYRLLKIAELQRRARGEQRGPARELAHLNVAAIAHLLFPDRTPAEAIRALSELDRQIPMDRVYARP